MFFEKKKLIILLYSHRLKLNYCLLKSDQKIFNLLKIIYFYYEYPQFLAKFLENIIAAIRIKFSIANDPIRRNKYWPFKYGCKKRRKFRNNIRSI